MTKNDKNKNHKYNLDRFQTITQFGTITQRNPTDFHILEFTEICQSLLV